MASTLASKREEEEEEEKEEEEHISVTFKERITIHLWEGGGGGDLPLTQRACALQIWLIEAFRRSGGKKWAICGRKKYHAPIFLPFFISASEKKFDYEINFPHLRTAHKEK